VFAGVIPYRDIFMTDIFATAAAVDLVATLLASRVQAPTKKSRLGWIAVPCTT